MKDKAEGFDGLIHAMQMQVLQSLPASCKLHAPQSNMGLSVSKARRVARFFNVAAEPAEHRRYRCAIICEADLPIGRLSFRSSKNLGELGPVGPKVVGRLIQRLSEPRENMELYSSLQQGLVSLYRKNGGRRGKYGYCLLSVVHLPDWYEGSSPASEGTSYRMQQSSHYPSNHRITTIIAKKGRYYC